MSASSPAPTIPVVSTTTFASLCQLANRLESALTFPSGPVAPELKGILFDGKFNFTAEQNLTSGMVSKAQFVVERLTNDVYHSFSQIIQLRTVPIEYESVKHIVDDIRNMVGLNRLIPQPA